MKNKKFALAVGACLMASMAMLTGCGHTCTFGNWDVTKQATLFEAGEQIRYCTSNDGKFEKQIITADGQTTNIKAYFNMYDDQTEVGTKGIILKVETESECGPSTYFGETDKNFDWNGEETTIAFKLDLSALDQVGDYTEFVLGFNKLVDTTYSHVTEIRFGIAKVENGFKFAELMGVDWTNHTEKDTILESDKVFTANDVECGFKIAYNNDTNVLSYSLIADTLKIENTQTLTDDIAGLRYLWNTFSNVEGVELYNLEKK